MPFVTSVPFWFLAGKYALGNSSIVCRLPLWIFFTGAPKENVDIGIFLLSLKNFSSVRIS